MLNGEFNFLSLLSGLDSFVATKLYMESGKKGIAICFDYGQPEGEIEIAEILANYLGITLEIAELDLDINRIGDSPFYPFRNSIFLTTAANWTLNRTESRNLVTGLGTESSYKMANYPDCCASYIINLMFALNSGVPDNQTINIISPVMGWSKKEIFNWLVNNDLDDLIPMTTSCYEELSRKYNWGIGCGVCPHCEARKADFKLSKANIKNYKNDKKGISNGRIVKPIITNKSKQR